MARVAATKQPHTRPNRGPMLILYGAATIAESIAESIAVKRRRAFLRRDVSPLNLVQVELVSEKQGR